MALKVRIGGSRHTGLAAPPHKNIQNDLSLNAESIHILDGIDLTKSIKGYRFESYIINNIKDMTVDENTNIVYENVSIKNKNNNQKYSIQNNGNKLGYWLSTSAKDCLSLGSLDITLKYREITSNIYKVVNNDYDNAVLIDSIPLINDEYVFTFFDSTITRNLTDYIGYIDVKLVDSMDSEKCELVYNPLLNKDKFIINIPKSIASDINGLKVGLGGATTSTTVTGRILRCSDAPDIYLLCGDVEETESEDIYYITVVDEYQNSNNSVIKTSTRLTDAKKIGDSYSYTALDIPDGYKLVTSNSFSGVVTNDKTITFKYKKIPTYTITVEDVYKDSNGKVIKTETRLTESQLEGYNYSYSAISNNADYKVTGSTEYSGTLTSNKTITFNYTKLPTPYELTVTDVYISEGSVEGSFTRRIETRLTENHASGYEYSFDALNEPNYVLVEGSRTPYVNRLAKSHTCSGTISSSNEYIYFYYRRKSNCNITVIDEYIDENGVVISSNTRLTETKKSGDTYTYDALDVPDDCILKSKATYSGTVAFSAVTIKFIYKKKSNYIITVVDNYYDTDGSLLDTITRSSESYSEGSVYTYNALSPIPVGYELNGKATQSGTVTGAKTINFKYNKAPDVTITVKDRYLNTDESIESENVRFVETKAYGDSYSFDSLTTTDDYEIIGEAHKEGIATNNIEIVFIYKKIQSYTITIIDEYYSVDNNLQHSDERLTISKKAGETYSFTALSPVPEGYKVTSNNIYSGTVTDNMIITFIYCEDSTRFVTVKGFITYEDGTPIANKRIEIHSTPRYTVTDANGYYEVNYVGVGDHTFTIFANDDLNDNTPLVTCDLSVTKPDEDTVQVTFKTDDCEIETDTSITNVLKIDAILPVYTITVKDEYYNGNILESSNIRTTDSYKAGELYEYKALNPADYNLLGLVEYTGTCLENIELVFKYVKNTSSTPDIPVSPEPIKYSLKVINNFYNEDGKTLIKSEIREQKKVTQGTTYSYSPLEFEGYVSADKEIKSGVVNNDVSIVFSYYKEADEPVIESKKYLVTVIDELYSLSGDFIESNVRCIDTYEVNSNYTYEALNYDNYNVINVYSVNGIVRDDTTVTFKYRQKDTTEEIEKSYILRVRDIYYNEDGSLIRDETRLVQTNLKEGYKYKFEALKITDSYKIYHSNYKNNKVELEEELVTYDYYKVVGNSVIEDKISNDTDIVFQYIKCNLEGKAPDGVAILPVPDNKPLKDTVISGDPPKTGDNTNLVLIMALMSISLGSVILLKKIIK